MRNVLLLIAHAAGPAAAQTLRGLPIGVTLRVVDSSGATMEGRLSKHTGDSLWLAHEGRALRDPSLSALSAFAETAVVPPPPPRPPGSM